MARRERFLRLKSGYVIDRRITNTYMALVLLVVGLMLGADFLTGEHEKAYVTCPIDAIGGQCSNPIYGTCDLPACQKEVLRPGESIGERPRNWFDLFMLVLVGGGSTAVMLNHALYNVDGERR